MFCYSAKGIWEESLLSVHVHICSMTNAKKSFPSRFSADDPSFVLVVSTVVVYCIIMQFILYNQSINLAILVLSRTVKLESSYMPCCPSTCLFLHLALVLGSHCGLTIFWRKMGEILTK